MSTREVRLRETFDALTAIGRRLTQSLEEDCGCFPVTPERAESDDPGITKTLDAFLQRFNQTLDHVLRKLFPRLQAAISGSDELLPVRELFENLHRAGIIEDIDAWRELLEVRDRLTHDYALDPLERAATLNDAWMRASALLAQIDRAHGYALQHKLIDGEGE